MLNLTNFQVKYLMKDKKKNAEKIEKLQTFDLSYFLRKFFLILVLKICLFINHHLIR